jgi:hypothetical protein
VEKAESMSKAELSNGGETPNIAPATSATALVAGPVSNEDYRAALKKAEKGDDAAMCLVLRAFDEKPERWRSMGNVGRLARCYLAMASAGKDNLPSVEACLRTMTAKEAEITPPDASPLEKLLAARIATAWFEVRHMDAMVALNSINGINGLKGRALDLLDKRRDRADRRFRHAIKDLATVRRLLRPGSMLQVNAGVAQVNVGAPVATGSAR